jgi:peptidoglycan/xylan/chitin deacetylase (PgdA/CDA1 family)
MAAVLSGEWKGHLKRLWWGLSQPVRLWQAARYTAQSRWPAAVLFYHRIAKHADNDWSMTASDFRRQLDWIGRRAEVCRSLDEVRQGQLSGERPRLLVHITFDDGYAENCTYAIPELLQRGWGCTYFVATRFVEFGEPFPHDVGRGRVLPVNTKRQIQEMAEAGIQIGSHGINHMDFGAGWPLVAMQRELVGARKRLQDWTGQPIDYFSFPYGLPRNISQEAIDLVAEAGYRGFVSAYGGWNWPGGDAFHFQRFHADPGLIALANILSLDPRLIRRRPQLHYQSPQRPRTTQPLVSRKAFR